MSDLNLLRAMMERKQFTGSFKSIPLELYDSNTVAMLQWFKLYFKSYEEHDRVDVPTLGSLIKLKTNQTKEAMALTNEILRQLKVPLPMDVRANTINALEERRLSAEAAMICKKYDDGEEIDVIFELNKLAIATKQRVELQTQAAWCDTDVWELIQADADDSGYVFDFLPEEISGMLRGVTEGKNICVAADTDKGKTSFLVRIAESFTKQRMKLMQQDSNLIFRPVLYLINESNAEVITPRVYQTALNIDRQEMWDLGASGDITPKYIQAVGRRDAIRLVNIHGKNVAQVARIIEAHDPFLVITDMTGRIRVNGGGNGANDIDQLEEVWNDMRTLAEMHKFIHVGTAQISAEGKDMLYPPLSALQKSKTGIQTTLDLAIWIGAYANPTPDNEYMRGISTPKNKLVKSGCRSYNTCLTYFKPEINDWNAVVK